MEQEESEKRRHVGQQWRTRINTFFSQGIESKKRRISFLTCVVIIQITANLTNLSVERDLHPIQRHGIRVDAHLSLVPSGRSFGEHDFSCQTGYRSEL